MKTTLATMLMLGVAATLVALLGRTSSSSKAAEPMAGSAAASHADEYEPPDDIRRANGLNRASVLVGEPDYRVIYTWHDESKRVELTAYKRSGPGGDWLHPVTKTETVAFYLTAVAPLYDAHELFVIGVQGTASNPDTVIERWKVNLAQNPMTGQFSIGITKEHVLTDSTLTHLWAAAAGQRGDFIVAQNFESLARISHQLS